MTRQSLFCATAVILFIAGCEQSGRSSSGPCEFWNKGDRAMVTVRGERLPECRRIEAPETPFTAQGQEPAWQLRITDQTIELTENYGTRQLSFPHAEPTISGGIVHYRTTNDDHELEIFIEPSICRDIMSGMPYPATVRYALDGEMSNGCGGAPEDLLLGGEWRVSSIAGEPVLENAAPTIEFVAEDSRVAGQTGCNRFTGKFELTGEGLNFSSLGTTMMACAGPGVQEQESRFVEAMQKTFRFEAPAFDRLHLVTSDGEIIEASR
ncbi:hypothetical protein CWI75_02410 [Kineobactrum sediminis]|uniref:DUF306 domain-containing protein n=1 Tax=Kineobactrum sediminis TaxID=1905677 RepID=A0A2N5Y749_9GAMM|nr:META domain-containing protein [Kineobactrum sediminis]PLW84218.1 hypothetical protein CWI75_02410 [Kineobactrum sediminis]